jgi:hypothetical protein
LKIKQTLSNKLPDWHVGLGFAFFALGGLAKDNLPKAIGLLPIIQLPCAFLSSVLIPLGSLLALHALILQTSRRRTMLCYHLLARFLPS